MADVLFYEKIAALDVAQHGRLRAKPVESFAYAKAVNSVPVVVGEFNDVCKEYPIVFARGADEAWLPVAVVGLRDNENLMVDAAGKWDARYVPAFVRRYPFVPADAGEKNSVLCIDEKAACFSETEGEPLFVDGQPSSLVRNAITLLQGYQEEAQRTAIVASQLAEADLLTENRAQIELADGATYSLSGMYTVDEKRLQSLPAERAQTLLVSGALGFAYAHLLSLSNLQRLVDRLAARRAS